MALAIITLFAVAQRGLNMDKYAAGAKALYEFNQKQLGGFTPWDEAKIGVKLIYWKRAKVVIDTYEKDIAR
jgi:hypothetical protein